MTRLLTLPRRDDVAGDRRLDSFHKIFCGRNIIALNQFQSEQLASLTDLSDDHLLERKKIEVGTIGWCCFLETPSPTAFKIPTPINSILKLIRNRSNIPHLHHEKVIGVQPQKEQLYSYAYYGGGSRRATTRSTIRRITIRSTSSNRLSSSSIRQRSHDHRPTIPSSRRSRRSQ